MVCFRFSPFKFHMQLFHGSIIHTGSAQHGDKHFLVDCGAWPACSVQLEHACQEVLFGPQGVDLRADFVQASAKYGR